MNLRLLAVAVWLLAGWAPMFAAEAEEDLSPAQEAAIAEKLAPSLVRVEYTLRLDKGEEPDAYGWGERCPNCGSVHGTSAASVIEEERPLETNGYLVADRRVLAPDLMIHPRFVEKIEVVFGEARVAACPFAFVKDQNAIFLELQEPLPGARPLAFAPDREPPYLAVSAGRLDGVWTTSVESVSSAVSVRQEEGVLVALPSNALLVDREGVPVGLSMSGETDLKDSWKGSPDAWPVLSAEEVRALTDRVTQTADRAVLRIQLGFRSPKKEEGERTYYSRGDDDEATERHVTGILVGPDRILVLANLAQKVTARLERIKVFPPKGEPVAATFEGTLKDYGVFLATLEKPLDGPVAFASGPIRSFRSRFLVGADVRIQGENRVVYGSPRRISGFDYGWQRNIYPEIPGGDETTFLFDEKANLVAFPIARRPKAGQQERWSSENPKLTAATQLAPVLGALAQNVDPSNVPLSEEEENRIAWLGVLLQPMDRELARVNKVSHLTQDGETGAIVSYVYPDSPADKAGVKAGWILLRLHVEDYPKPLEIRMEGDRSGDWEFPWEHLDELSEEYYDRIPPPWQPVENSFTRMITDIGFGKKYRAEFVALRPAQGDPEHGRGVADGQTVFKDFEVLQSPPHFGAAPKFKSDALGITVRDMTYEVRRYLQKEPNDPGIVISKVEPGSKASVAGIKPYENITHVNEQPVANVKDFERLIAGRQELRLAVKRMVQGRVVKITFTGGPEKPEKPE